MGSSTLFLILKSLFPFIREIILKDKVVKDIFLENKLATMLFGCVTFLFLLFLYVNGAADSAQNDLRDKTQENQQLAQQVTELKSKVDGLEEERTNRGQQHPHPIPPGPAPADPAEHHLPDRNVSTPAPRGKQKRTEGSLKFYIESRFKTFD